MVAACADLFEAGPATLRGSRGMPPCPPLTFCVVKRKKGNKGKQERLSKQTPLKGCLSHWWPTILFSVPWPLHFEIDFAGPENP